MIDQHQRDVDSLVESFVSDGDRDPDSVAAKVEAELDRRAEAEIDALAVRYPEVVHAIYGATLAASPLAGPQRILAEIRSHFPETERRAIEGDR